MKPLILEFVEKPSLKNLDFSLVEYCQKYNLSIIKGSDVPAIKYVTIETEVLEYLDKESKKRLKQLLDTSTETLTSAETSDSDNDLRRLKLLIDTQTLTEAVEGSDSDK